MKILITGGAGFLGQRLAQALLANPAYAELVLADIAPLQNKTLSSDARVQSITGDLRDLLSQGVLDGVDGVFHLAAAVSGECEADIDVGLHANLDTTRALLDACRKLPNVTTALRLVFSSSLAVYGGDKPAVITDTTLPMPQNSYGAQKFICEQLIADYTRKGYVNGRSVRLPTVTVRPGKPNAAASGFMSGIIREPLAGVDALCPVDPATGVWITSPRYAVAGLIAAFETPQDKWGSRIAMNLPGLSVRVSEMIEALRRRAGEAVAARVKLKFDDAISRIVGGWPWRFDTTRARGLGLSGPAAMDDIIAEYRVDYPQALTP